MYKNNLVLKFERYLQRISTILYVFLIEMIFLHTLLEWDRIHGYPSRVRVDRGSDKKG